MSLSSSRGLVAIGLLLVLIACPASARLNAYKAAFKTNQSLFKPMMVLIGDSMTEYGFQAPHGWALQLSAAYSRRADIINRGFGGASVNKND